MNIRFKMRNSIDIISGLEEFKNENYGYILYKKFTKHKLAVAGSIIMFVIFLCAIFAPALAPYQPNKLTGTFNARPSLNHLLGTDQVGRDELSRIIFASRISLCVGIGTIVISVIIGVCLGLISGFFGGFIDMIIMRVTDMFMAFPSIMLILVLASIMGPGLVNIIMILGFLGWPGVARLVRGNVLAIKESDYIKASIVTGIGTLRILFYHILPNTLAPILVYSTSGIAEAILDEAALSFLGLGVQPPTASWGNMLNNAQSLSILTSEPWIWIPPGLMIILSVLSINFIGDALRDALDPTSKKKS